MTRKTESSSKYRKNIENNDSNSGVETVTKNYDNTNNIDFKEKQRDS